MRPTSPPLSSCFRRLPLAVATDLPRMRQGWPHSSRTASMRLAGSNSAIMTKRNHARVSRRKAPTPSEITGLRFSIFNFQFFFLNTQRPVRTSAFARRRLLVEKERVVATKMQKTLVGVGSLKFYRHLANAPRVRHRAAIRGSMACRGWYRSSTLTVGQPSPACS